MGGPYVPNALLGDVDNRSFPVAALATGRPVLYIGACLPIKTNIT